MNQLPQHRQVLHGRTWGRQWSPEDYDPITVYRANGGIAFRVIWLAIVAAVAAVAWSVM